MITFDETEKQGHWTWHYGNFENDNKEYPFSLLEMYDNTSGTSSYELTWCDDTPPNNKEIEKQIYLKF